MRLCPECKTRLFPLFTRHECNQPFNVSYEYKCKCGWSEKVEFPFTMPAAFTMRRTTTKPATETQTESQSE